MTIDEQIQRSAAAGMPHEEIAAIFGVTLNDVQRVLAAHDAAEPDETSTDVRPLTGDRRVEAYHRIVRRKEPIERVAAALRVTVACIEATLREINKRPRVRGPVDEAAAANARLHRMLAGRSGARTVDGDRAVTRRPHETDSELYLRERGARGRRGREVL